MYYMFMDQKQIIINNQLISYLSKTGTGEKCLLFLHGWGSNKEVWQKIVDSDQWSEASVYCMDLPGFGNSPLASKKQIKEGWSVCDYAEIVKGFIEKLGLKNVIIVGHSFGGRVGIKLVSNFPSLLLKLVLVDSAGFIDSSSKKRILVWTSKIVRPLFKLQFLHSVRRRIYKKIGTEDYINMPELKETFVKIVSEDLSENMARVVCPTLIIWGENDVVTPPAFGERMKFLIPNSELIILSQAGHYSFLDKPEEFVKILIDFITLA